MQREIKPCKECNTMQKIEGDICKKCFEKKCEEPMQRENKWQDRFDEKFKVLEQVVVHGEFLTPKIKSFIQSEIDTAIADRDKEIKELKDEIEDLKDSLLEVYEY